MLHIHDSNEDFRDSSPTNYQNEFNAIFIAPDDLSGTGHSPTRLGTNTIYVKPLPSDNVDKYNWHSQTSRFPKAKQTAEILNPHSHVEIERISKSVERIKLDAPVNTGTSFSRNSALRRSLGGAAITAVVQNYSDTSQNGFDTTNEHRAQNSPCFDSSMEHNQNSDLRIFRVTNLPLWDDVGFIIQPCNKSNSEFIGLKLVEKSSYDDRYLQSRRRTPFKSGDVIMSVNHHKLSRMSVPNALQCVQYAWREARQYVVEFGVKRSSIPMNNEPYIIEASTLPHRLSRRKPTSINSSDSESLRSPHQPRRHHARTDATEPYIISVSKRDSSCMEKSSPTLSVTPPNTYETNQIYLRERANSRSQSSYKHGSIYVIRPNPCSTTDHELQKHLTTVDSPNTSGSSCCPLRNAGEHVMTSPTTSVMCKPSKSVNSDWDTASEHSLSPDGVCKSLGSRSKYYNAFNTRSIGQKLFITLEKMAVGGLGFSLTSRDTQTSSELAELVYVKKISSEGAAIVDARLMIGDRLLAVNNEPVQSLAQVLVKLRSLEPGQTVDLLVSRQVTDDSGEMEITKPKSSRPFVSFTYEYYLPQNLHELDELPALGINFKWSDDVLFASEPQHCNSSSCSSYAAIPGLYVDSLLPDAVVTNNDRVTLQYGDRLVGVNGESMDGLSAKKIVAHIKSTLTTIRQVALTNARNTGKQSIPNYSFSLTVHRYRHRRYSKVSDQLRSEANLSSTDSPHRINMASSTEPHRCITSSDARSGLGRYESSLYSSNQLHCMNSSTEHIAGDPNKSPTTITEMKYLNETCNPPASLNNHSSCRYSSVPSRIRAMHGGKHFVRDGLGRRSVSEKRHGHFDATQYQFFRTDILPNRCKMPEDVDKQYSTMPTARRIRMHKNRQNYLTNNQHSSTQSTPGPLRALHPIDLPDNVSKQSPLQFDRREIPRISTSNQPEVPQRNRKQNRSFRHAVDRSLQHGQQECNQPHPSSSATAITTFTDAGSAYSYCPTVAPSCAIISVPSESFPLFDNKFSNVVNQYNVPDPVGDNQSIHPTSTLSTHDHLFKNTSKIRIGDHLSNVNDYDHAHKQLSRSDTINSSTTNTSNTLVRESTPTRLIEPKSSKSGGFTHLKQFFRTGLLKSSSGYTHGPSHSSSSPAPIHKRLSSNNNNQPLSSASNNSPNNITHTPHIQSSMSPVKNICQQLEMDYRNTNQTTTVLTTVKPLNKTSQLTSTVHSIYGRVNSSTTGDKIKTKHQSGTTQSPPPIPPRMRQSNQLGRPCSEQLFQEHRTHSKANSQKSSYRKSNHSTYIPPVANQMKENMSKSVSTHSRHQKSQKSSSNQASSRSRDERTRSKSASRMTSPVYSQKLTNQSPTMKHSSGTPNHMSSAHAAKNLQPNLAYVNSKYMNNNTQNEKKSKKRNHKYFSTSFPIEQTQLNNSPVGCYPNDSNPFVPRQIHENQLVSTPQISGLIGKISNHSLTGRPHRNHRSNAPQMNLANASGIS